MKKSDFHLIAAALNRAEVPFLVVGGLAVVEHGYGRSTFDVDLVVSLERDAVLRAFAALAEIGYQPRVPITAAQFAEPAERRRLLVEKRMEVLNFWSDEHRETPLDLFVTEPFNFADEHAKALERDLGSGISVKIISLPTLLAMKQAARRPKDLADIDELSLLHGFPSSYDDPE